MYQANIHEAKANLSLLIKHALAGDEVIIAKNNEPLVRLMPISQDNSPRVGGFLAGQIKFLEDPEKSDAEIAALFINSPLFPDSTL